MKQLKKSSGVFNLLGVNIQVLGCNLQALKQKTKMYCRILDSSQSPGRLEKLAQKIDSNGDKLSRRPLCHWMLTTPSNTSTAVGSSLQHSWILK